jgi:glycosyltransferase involved in cell wall biosynthesis
MSLHVAMVTSWAPRWCGIAIYAAELCAALAEADVRVSIVAHTDAAVAGVKPVIDQADPAWPEKLEQAVEDLDPDVVHIQHEFGLFATPLPTGEFSFAPEDAFRLTVPLFRWQVRRRPVVVTYHSVFTHLSYPEAIYYDHMMSLAAANIVHEPVQKVHLPYNLGRVPDNVFVIPHGAGRQRPPASARRTVREEIGVGEETVVGMMGWFEPNKGFDRVLRMWPRIRRECPHAVLVLAGEARPGSPTGPRTREEYLTMARESSAADSIRVVLGAFPPERYLAILSSFDVIVLPYTYATQSGNLAHAYQVGLPVVVSAIEGLKSSVEASRAGLLARDDEELQQAIVRLVRDSSLRGRLSRAARAYVNGVIAWDRVARRHLEVYRWARRRVRDRSRYAHYAVREVHV